MHTCVLYVANNVCIHVLSYTQYMISHVHRMQQSTQATVVAPCLMHGGWVYVYVCVVWDDDHAW